MHHAHTNVVGLGDSSVWKAPFLPRTVYLFVAPLAVPVITPLVAFCKTPLTRVDPPLALSRHFVLTRALDVWFRSSPQRTLGGSRRPDRPHGGAGPVFAVLATDPRVRVPLAAQWPALHAGVQSHVLRAVHPCQHLPGEERQRELNAHITPSSWRPC